MKIINHTSREKSLVPTTLLFSLILRISTTLGGGGRSHSAPPPPTGVSSVWTQRTSALPPTHPLSPCLTSSRWIKLDRLIRGAPRSSSSSLARYLVGGDGVQIVNTVSHVFLFTSWLQTSCVYRLINQKPLCSPHSEDRISAPGALQLTWTLCRTFWLQSHPRQKLPLLLHDKQWCHCHLPWAGTQFVPIIGLGVFQGHRLTAVPFLPIQIVSVRQTLSACVLTLHSYV